MAPSSRMTDTGSIGETTLHIVTPRADFVAVLDGVELALGRGASNDLQIDAAVVSAAHARLLREGSTYRYVHLSQTNPTLLRGMPIADVVLQDGDRLEIGPGTPEAVTIVFRQSPTLANIEFTRTFSARDVLPATAVGRLALPPDGVVTIGRRPDSDLWQS